MIHNLQGVLRLPFIAYINRPKSIILLCSFMLLLQVAVADVVVDGGTQTTTDQAQNGVPIVNISQPNNDGVSRNTYSNFSVNNEGLILNNSNNVGVSQLGGAMAPNANLTSGGANIILNEVTSNVNSSLNGYVETFGQSAEFILANPNGITCSGCGFINTTRATLISGSENNPNGPVGSFSLGTGQIQILGSGLNGSNLDYVDIITRAASIQAQLQAKQSINIKTGNDQYDYATGIVSSVNSATAAPSFAIDAGALGSMFAGSIQLISTEAGVGVRSMAESAADTDLIINSAGGINASKLKAGRDLSLLAGSIIDQTGSFQAGNILTLEADTLTLRDLVESDNRMDLTARVSDFDTTNASITGGIGDTNLSVNNGNLILGSALFSTGSLTLAGQNIFNQNRTATKGDLTVNTSGNLTNTAGNLMFAGNNARFNVDGTLDNSGILYSGADLTALNQSGAQMQALYNRGGRIQSLGAMSLSAALIENTHNFPDNNVSTSMTDVSHVAIRSSTGVDSLTGQENWFEIANPALSRGLIDSGTDLKINADTINNNVADIFANGNVIINANQVTNNGYALQEAITEQKQVWGVVGKDCLFGRWNCKNKYGWITTNVQTIRDSGNFLAANIQATGTVNITTPANGIVNNSVIRSNAVASPSAPVSDPLANLSLPGQGSFFSVNNNPNPNYPYLIETDPALIDLATFYGSDYFLSRIGYTPTDDTIMFLGDAFYEQQLIAEQVRTLVGQRFILNAKDDNDMYRRLADQAALERERLELEVGQHLTTEQQDALQENILWYVETEVAGKTVLVPKVYLSKVTRDRVAKKRGANIMGEQMAVHAGNVMNSGTMLTETALAIYTEQDIKNISGSIDAGSDLTLVANGNIVNETRVTTKGDTSLATLVKTDSLATALGRLGRDQAGYTESELGPEATIEAGGNANLKAENDISFIAASLKAEGDSTLQAGNDLSIGTAELLEVRVSRTKKEAAEMKRVTYASSSIEGKGDLRLLSQNDINIEAAKLTADGNMQLAAMGNVLITSVQDTYNYQWNQKKRRKKRSHTVNTLTHRGAELASAGDLSIYSGADTLVLASKLKSGKDMTLASNDGDIMLLSAANNNYNQATYQKKGWVYKEGTDKGQYAENLAATRIDSDGNLVFSTGVRDSDDTKGNVLVTGANVSSKGYMRFGKITLKQNDRNAISGYTLTEDDAARINNLTFDTVALQNKDWDRRSKEMRGWAAAMAGIYTWVSGDEVQIKKTNNVTVEKLTNKGTNVNSGGDFVAFTEGDITLKAAKIESERNGLLDARGDIQLLAAVDRVTRTEENETLTVDGWSFKKEEGRVSVGLDGAYKKNELREATYSPQGTELSFAGNLSLYSDRDINIVAAKLGTQGYLTIEAKNALSVMSADQILERAEKVTEASARISVGVGNTYYDFYLAIKAYKEAKKVRKQAEKALKAFDAEIQQMQKDLAKGLVTTEDIKLRKEDKKYYQLNVAMAVVNEINAAVGIGTAGQAMAASAATYGFYVDVALELKGSKTTQTLNQTTSMASTLLANKDMHLKSQQNLTIKGSDLRAQGNIQLASASDVLISAAGQTQRSDEQTKAIDFKISAGMYGQSSGKNNWNAGLSKGYKKADAVNWRGSSLQAGNDIGITSDRDVKVHGSRVKAENSIKLAAANDISIEASRNTRNNRSENKSFSISGSSKEVKNKQTKKDERVNTGWSVGFNQSRDNSNIVNWQNSELQAGNELAMVSGKDMSFVGANAKAKSIDLDVGGDLTVKSRQNTVYSRGRSFGIKVGTASSGLNGGQRKQDRQWADDQTMLIASEGVDINVANKTSNTGAVIAHIDSEGNDGGNLSLTTKEFAYADLNDYDRKSNWRAGFSSSLLGVNNLKKAFRAKREQDQATSKQIEKQAKNNNRPVKKRSKAYFGSTSVNLAKDGHQRGQLSYASIGQGNLNVADPYSLSPRERVGVRENEGYLARLNRDIKALTKTTANRNTGGLDAKMSVDHRLLTKGGRNVIKRDFYNVYRHGKDIVEVINIITNRKDIGISQLGKQVNHKNEQRIAIGRLVNQALARKGFNYADATPEEIVAAMQAYINETLEGKELAKQAGVYLYNGDPNAIGMSRKTINKNLAPGVYDNESDDIGVNVWALNVLSTDAKLKIIGHEGYHALIKNKGYKFSSATEEVLSNSFGNSASAVWKTYSRIGGYETDINSGVITHSDWLEKNRNSKEIKTGNEWIKNRDSAQLEECGGGWCIGPALYALYKLYSAGEEAADIKKEIDNCQKKNNCKKALTGKAGDTAINLISPIKPKHFKKLFGKSKKTSGKKKKKEKQITLYRAQPVSKYGHVTGGVFGRKRYNGSDLVSANKERQKLLNKFDNPSNDGALVKTMQNAQANGKNNPYISTTVKKAFAFDRARRLSKEFNTPYEVVKIKGPRNKAFNYEARFKKLGGRSSPKRQERDPEQKEYGIRDLFIPRIGKSRSGFQIKKRWKIPYKDINADKKAKKKYENWKQKQRDKGS